MNTREVEMAVRLLSEVTSVHPKHAVAVLVQRRVGHWWMDGAAT